MTGERRTQMEWICENTRVGQRDYVRERRRETVQISTDVLEQLLGEMRDLGSLMCLEQRVWILEQWIGDTTKREPRLWQGEMEEERNNCKGEIK